MAIYKHNQGVELGSTSEAVRAGLELATSGFQVSAWKECEIKELRLIIHYLTRSQIVCKFKILGELEREVLVKVEDILQALTCYVINVTIRQSSDVTISTLCRSFA